MKHTIRRVNLWKAIAEASYLVRHGFKIISSLRKVWFWYQIKLKKDD